MMRKLLFTLCVIACYPYMAVAQNIESIQEAMSNYDYETALELIGEETPDIPLLYLKGKALKGLGNNAEALNVFQVVVAQDSLDPRAYIEVAECCRSLAKYGEALDCYRNALRLSPENKYVRLQYISMLMALKRYRESLAECNSLAEHDSSSYVLHLQAESMDQVYGYTMPELVIETYKKIRQRYPDDYLSAAKLGKIYTQCYRYDDAIAVTEQYRGIDSTNLLVNRVNAQAYCLNKEYPKAIERYRWLLQEKDSTFQTCYYAGLSHYSRGDFYSAHDLFAKALQEAPTNINLLYYLGRSCSKTSWKQEGVQYLETAIALAQPSDSTMSRLYRGLSDCYKSNRQYRDAAETLLSLYENYDRGKHRLLVDAAYLYYMGLQDNLNTERCLEAYLNTRHAASEQENADSASLANRNESYDAAARWLKTIRERRKREEFFQGKVDTASVAPID